MRTILGVLLTTCELFLTKNQTQHANYSLKNSYVSFERGKMVKTVEQWMESWCWGVRCHTFFGVGGRTMEQWMKSWGWGVRCHRWGERVKFVCFHGVRSFVVIFRV